MRFVNDTSVATLEDQTYRRTLALEQPGYSCEIYSVPWVSVNSTALHLPHQRSSEHRLLNQSLLFRRFAGRVRYRYTHPQIPVLSLSL
jgi:hypothetical protein